MSLLSSFGISNMKVKLHKTKFPYHDVAKPFKVLWGNMKWLTVVTI